MSTYVAAVWIVGSINGQINGSSDDAIVLWLVA